MTSPNPDFWRGRRVLVTGHTGFKGAWMCAWLAELGAEVTGFALAPDPGTNLFRELAPLPGLNSTIGDVRDRAALVDACEQARPEIAIHMAAQSLVRRSFLDPRGTHATNVQGTGNLLEALEPCASLRAILIVTSDKCYRNDNSGRPFVETDPLGGNDPYSASKAAQETIAIGWRRGLLENRDGAARLATARAGNVVGGGDWSEDRILPDLFRAIEAGEALDVRNPGATRPWQHVLDVLAGYLDYAEALSGDDARNLPSALNFGPHTAEAKPVQWLVERALDRVRADGIAAKDWAGVPVEGPHEAAHLALDAGLAAKTLGWRPRLTQEDAIDWTADWHAGRIGGKPATTLVRDQISRFSDLTPAI
jgi:CDP-glucose 4,6-dehydratase